MMIFRLHHHYRFLTWLRVFALVVVYTVQSTIAGLSEARALEDTGPESAPKSADRLHDRKILWVSSYHEGYEANDDIERGIRAILKDKAVQLQVLHMDTKRNDAEDFGVQAGLRALAMVKEFAPDVIIASDDNAQKYLVVPYLLNTGIPIVFCGVNWDASIYGYPTKNVTGMVEVDLIELFEHLGRHARGKRLGYLGGNVETERKVVDIYNDRFFKGSMKSYLVTSMDEFKTAFLKAQEEVDMLYISNYTGIKDWDRIEAELFLSRHARIPTGSHHGFMAPYVVFVVSKSMEEHGVYAASTALKILEGVSPAEIPVSENSRAELILNLRMAAAVSIVPPLALLKTATIIGQEELQLAGAGAKRPAGGYTGRKILWVDSYHQGYEWSDEMEKGIRDVLYDTGVNLQIVRMDSKRNDSATYGRDAGLRARAAVQEFKPDVVIASDDNAQKYLVVPFLKDSELPVIFCGVNWDAAIYGYPTANITGMVEEDLVPEMLKRFQAHARGKRIGYLAGNVETERKIVDIYNKRFFNGEMKTYLVNSMDAFKDAFLRAQKEVDMLYISNYSGIADWHPAAVEKFLLTNSKIPTGSHNSFMAPYVLFTVAKLPLEQGDFAAKTALRILDGLSPAQIPVAVNELNHITINVKMAQAANFVLPASLLKGAKLIGQGTLQN
ncbi:MAG: hypothetical protein OEL83_17130 [Desulforhopalus sp.]|nr:hypothetical protein [Desulforhopalus sp.]